MNTNPRKTRLSSLAALVLSALPASAEDTRMWTDKASGKTIDAAYVSADATTRTVTIMNKDGQQFTLPVARLSDADVEFIRAKLQAPATPPAPATPGVPPPAAPAKPAKAPSGPVGQPAPPAPVFKVLPVKGFKGPGGSDYIRSVPKVRPRLLQSPQGWAALKARVGQDPVLDKMMVNLKKGGEDLLQKPELNKIFGTEKARGAAEGAQAMSRIATLGTLHFLDGDPKWKERAIRELDVLTDSRSFSDWSPAEAELCADFTTAVALGYDWFRDGLNAEQQKRAKEFLIQKGMEALAAHLEGKPVPETARTKAPGTADTKPTKAPAKPATKEKGKTPPTKEEMIAASALIMAAICLADEESGAARAAADAAGKIFSEGVQLFAPSGIWPEGMEAGDEVLDSVVMVLQTLRASCGGDFGISYLEGLPQAGPARMHLVGPKGMFNYGDAGAGNLSHSWVSTWLAGVHGNPGLPAVTGGPAPSAASVFLNLAGHIIYYNPWAAGYGTASSFDAVFASTEVATLRSAWNDPQAAFVALKGGDNEEVSSHLDLGSFVLDMGGVRWAVEMGGEGDRVGGFETAKGGDRSKRYTFYLAGTKGQNTLVVGGADLPDLEDDKKAKKGAPAPAPAMPGNQPLDAKAKFIGFNTTPERGVAIVDLSDAYSSKTKSVHRGAMMVRGPSPYVLMQDDIEIKGTTTVEWNMHTTATIEVAGNKATLTNGEKGKGQTLNAVLLSPPGATFTTAEPPEKANEQARDLKNFHILRVNLAEAKGEQRITIAFTTAAEAPTAPVVPLTAWLPKK
jgi:hypothetical protein